MLTHSYILENFNYDPLTGIVTRNKRMGAGPAGGVVGSYHNMGYLRVMLFRKSYLLHRVIWFYVHGKWPEQGLDHINGIKTDNRLCNLREADQAQNMANRGPQTNNKSGYKGVWWDNTNKRWKSYIHVRKRRICLGTFKNLEDAVEAYKIAAVQYHGEFARAA